MYQLRLFGPPALHDPEGAAIAVGRPAGALLALLARAPACTLGRDRASELLWPDADDTAARRALRQRLFRLRAQAPDLVLSDRTHIRLNAAATRVDVLEFERAHADGRFDEAAALHVAPFLDGRALPHNGDLQRWADGERETLRRMAGTAFERIVEDATQHGRWDDALRAAQRWLDAEPFSERAVTAVIAVRAQLGDRAAALAAWETFQTRVVHELGSPPAPALERLVQRVRRHAGAALEAEAGERSASERRQRGGEALLPLVGRDEEFAHLSGRWAAACRDVAQLVLVRGEAGIGKTRLAADFARWVGSRGATVLATRAWEIEADVPYAALAGTLRDGLRAPGLGGVEARTLTELGRIVPEYTTRFAGVLPPADGEFEAGKLRIMDAFRDLVDSLAHEAPVLLYIDDLPFADEATRTTLHYAWRRLTGRPLMLLATARATTDVELRGAAELLRAVARDAPDAASVIELGPLHRDAVEQLAASVRRAIGAPQSLDATRLEQRSGGNPLYLSELLRAAANGVADSAPNETIRLVTLERLGALDGDSRALLEAAAVLGRQFPLPVAGDVSGLAAPQRAAAVDSLIEHGLLRQVDYGYDFVHEVVRDTVIAGLGAETLRLLHGRAFAALQPDDAQAAVISVAAERAGALARHAAGAALRAEAYRWYLASARTALALYATAEVSRALGSALEFADSDVERCEAWRAIAEFARVRSDFRGAAYAYQQAFLVAGEAAHRLRLRLRMLHMGTRAGLLSAADVEALAAELSDAVSEAGDDMRAELQFIRADAATRSGSLERAEACAADAADAFRAAGDARGLVRTLLLAAAARAQSGGGGVLDLLTEAEAAAERSALHPELMDVRVERATELSRLGRWDDSLAAFAAVKRAAIAVGDWGNATIACINAGDLRVRRGDWSEARREFLEIDGIVDRFDFPHAAVVTAVNRALMEWLSGAVDAAIEAARTTRARAEAAGLDAPAAAAAAIHALAAFDRGDVDGAAAALETVTDGAARHATWSDDSELLAGAQARLLAARGFPAAALALLDDAMRSRRDPYAAAFLDCERSALLAATEPQAAAGLADRARRAALALGARPLAARAAAVMQKSGPADALVR